MLIMVINRLRRLKLKVFADMYSHCRIRICNSRSGETLKAAVLNAWSGLTLHGNTFNDRKERLTLQSVMEWPGNYDFLSSQE